MTVTTLSGKKLLIKLETATPGTYAVICGIKAKTFKVSRSTVDTTVQACDDPDDVYTETDVGPMSNEVTGSGVAAKENVGTLYDWLKDGTAKNIQVVAEGVGWSTWAGAAVLSDFEVTGDVEGGKVEISISLKGSGAWTRTTNA